MIYIIADDLTGASDTGVQFKRIGLRTAISAEINIDVLEKLYEKFEVISINADTRSLMPEEAYAQTFNLTKRIGTNANEYIYKKVDSLMRGNAAEELQAVMDGCEASLAIVAISYPANGRVLSDGKMLLPRSENEIDVVALFKQGMREKVCGVPLATVRQDLESIRNFLAAKREDGYTVFVFDALTDKDLEIVSKTVDVFGGTAVYCGSAGLAGQLSKRHQWLQRQNGYACGSAKGVDLIVIGSRNPSTAEQIQALAEDEGVPIITVFTNEILNGRRIDSQDEIMNQVQSLIQSGCSTIALVVDALFEVFELSLRDSQENVMASMQIASFLGEMSSRICAAYPIETIISSGGDTSLAILKTLKAEAIEMDAEILPGVPIGRIVGGHADGIKLVTKSGGFGERSTLKQVMLYLNTIDLQ